MGYFQSVARNIKKYTVGGLKTDAEMNALSIRIPSGAVASEGVVDVFGEPGRAPRHRHSSDEFLQTVQQSEDKNRSSNC